MSYKACAFIGTREVPPEIIEVAKRVANKLAAEGYTFRLGGGDDSFDKHIEQLGTPSEIYLPWKGFNKKKSLQKVPDENCIELAKKFHPAFDKMSRPVQGLIARVSYMVLGENLRDPVKFVICYSEDGVEDATKRTAKTGPAGQAISLAASQEIPVFNLKNGDALDRLKRFLEGF